MREIKIVNSDLKLLQNFCHNDAYSGPNMVNIHKSLYPFLKCRTKAWFKPGYVNQSNGIYKAKTNLPILKAVSEVLSSTISYGGKIVFVCPITTSLQKSEWLDIEKNNRCYVDLNSIKNLQG